MLQMPVYLFLVCHFQVQNFNSTFYLHVKYIIILKLEEDHAEKGFGLCCCFLLAGWCAFRCLSVSQIWGLRKTVGALHCLRNATVIIKLLCNGRSCLLTACFFSKIHASITHFQFAIIGSPLAFHGLTTKTLHGTFTRSHVFLSSCCFQVITWTFYSHQIWILKFANALCPRSLFYYCCSWPFFCCCCIISAFLAFALFYSRFNSGDVSCFALALFHTRFSKYY